MGFIRPLRILAKMFTAAATPRQMAYGFALGMMIGLVPKGNLIALGLSVLLLSLRVNLGAGMVATLLFSWVGTLTDPFTHRVGEAFLNKPALQPTWAFLYDLPLAPWTAFNNTVVLGSLLLGLWLFYPVFRISQAAFARVQPLVVERLRNYPVVQLIWGLETTGSWRSQ